MKYKEFVRWCNERACDGKWSMEIALVCIDIMDKIRPLHFFWRRERKWKEINKEFQIEEMIKSIDIKTQQRKYFNPLGI